MATKQKRNRFSLELKYQIIKLIDEKTPLETIVAQFESHGIDIKNVYAIKSQRNKIIEYFMSKRKPNIKSLKKSYYEILDKDLAKYVTEMTAKGVHISGSALKAKAKELARYHGLDNFKNSNGYISSFRSRNQLLFQKNDGQTNDSVCSSDTSSEINWNYLLPQMVMKESDETLVIKSEVQEEPQQQHTEEETINLFSALESISRIRRFIHQTNGSVHSLDLVNKLEIELYRHRANTHINQNH